MEKICSKCGETKDVSGFCRNRSKKSGYSYWCKDCEKEFARKRGRTDRDREKSREYYHANRFVAALWASRKAAKRRGHAPCNATVEEIKAAFTGKCDICGVPELECSQHLHLDHCHETGDFRGWLCSKHNKMLGHAGDSEEILLNALDYLLDRKGSYCE